MMATLFRSIVKDANATNCHEFVDSIFHVPGTLKRSTIERIRIQISSEIMKK